MRPFQGRGLAPMLLRWPHLQTVTPLLQVHHFREQWVFELEAEDQHPALRILIPSGWFRSFLVNFWVRSQGANKVAGTWLLGGQVE